MPLQEYFKKCLICGGDVKIDFKVVHRVATYPNHNNNIIYMKSQ